MAKEVIDLAIWQYEPNDPFPNGLIIQASLIPVTLELNGKKVQRLDTLIDTGASTITYSKEYADALDIDLKSGKHDYLEGVGGHDDVWYHEIRLSFKGWSYKCLVGFVNRTLPVAGVLGYHGFFDRFIYTIDSAASNFTLERLPKIQVHVREISS